MRTLSKLVICVVMLRGRHRGLPVAIDRAVMLPRDFTASDEAAFEERLRRSRSRGGNSVDGGNFPRMYTNTTGMTDLDNRDSASETGSTRAGRAKVSPGLPPLRRNSSPSTIMRQNSRTQSAGSQDMTPSSLTFALNRAAAGRESGAEVSTSPNTRPAGTGFLTPVREMSRRPTMTEEPEELAAFRRHQD